MTPFLTLYTPTYKRPEGLARCLASVATQTIVADIEQLVIPDHVGVGIEGMYARVPDYASAVHGDYVMFLCDDDVLASPTVIEEVKSVTEAYGRPPVLIVKTQKAGMVWPQGDPWPPRQGAIDLNCAIVRRDVWQAHAHQYGRRYEGDFDFMHALYRAGHNAVWCPVLVSRGGVSHGEAEAA